MTPYQKLYNEPLSLTNLIVFGYLCYVFTSKSHRSEFDPRASPCMFVSDPTNQKAYKVFDLDTETIVIFQGHHIS